MNKTTLPEGEKYKLEEIVFTKNSLGHFTTPKIVEPFYGLKREIEFSEEQLIKMGAKKMKTTLENWEAELNSILLDNLVLVSHPLKQGHRVVKANLQQALKNLIRDLLASSQKDKEKAVERGKLEAYKEVLAFRSVYLYDDYSSLYQRSVELQKEYYEKMGEFLKQKIGSYENK